MVLKVGNIRVTDSMFNSVTRDLVSVQCTQLKGLGRAGKQAGFEGAGVNLPACPVFMRLSRRHFPDEHPLRKLKSSYTRGSVAATFV